MTQKYLEDLHSSSIFLEGYQQNYDKGASHWDPHQCSHFRFASAHSSSYSSHGNIKERLSFRTMSRIKKSFSIATILECLLHVKNVSLRQLRHKMEHRTLQERKLLGSIRKCIVNPIPHDFQYL